MTKIPLTPTLKSALQSLPAATLVTPITSCLTSGHNVVVEAPPGAGKSTLLPLAIAEALPQGRVMVLEPRRLAARQVAQRMAQLLGEDVGHTVGYQVRFERRISASTRIEVMTEGVLARRMADDPTLDGVACVVFDEFHERSLLSDVTLCLARHIRQVIRPDLRLVVMSATIDAGPIASALSAEVLQCSGRMFPVQVIHAQEDTTLPTIAQDVAAAVSRAHRESDGDILAFLPGQGDIESCAGMLGDALAPTQVYTLYGNLVQQQQRRAIAPSPPGQRKVVLATPIAETSITIEGVKTVVDSGYCRKLVYDSATGLTHLETVRISLDMARQRSGRAGRVAPGRCIRLWTQATENRMEVMRQPEILAADLSPMVLGLAAWGETDMMSLPWITPPPAGNLREATTSLHLLGALDSHGAITQLGQRMASLPCHPRIARMMVLADDVQQKQLACDIAALLEEKDPLGAFSADLTVRLAALRRARREGSLRQWKRIDLVACEYARMMHVAPGQSFVSQDEAGSLVAAAYPERVAQALDHNGNYRLADGQQASLEPSDTLAGHAWLAVAALHGDRRSRGRIFLAAPISGAVIDQRATWHDCISWNTRKGGVVAQREKRIGVLTVETRPLQVIDRDLLLSTVCNAVAKEGESVLNWTDDVSTLQMRVSLVAGWHPELMLPDLSTAHLLKNPEAWLSPFLVNQGGVVSTVTDLRKINLVEVLWSVLSYEQQQAVERLAPARIAVPTGSLVKLKYRVGAEAPVLSVRLQECFGLTDTPRVDGGRVPVLMELLSPGFKPVQLTTDLHSFWQTTYFDVRKELRRRYPKHHWPDNPLEAAPTRGVKRK